MEIRVRFIGIPSKDSTARDVRRRVSFALDRVAPSIRSVTVALRDENGPRGGIDQRCTVHIALRAGGRPVVVSALDASTGRAVAKALSRARARLQRRTPLRRSVA